MLVTATAVTAMSGCTQSGSSPVGSGATAPSDYATIATASGRGGTRTLTFEPVPEVGAIKITSTCGGGGVIGFRLEGSGVEANCNGAPVENIVPAPVNVKSVFIYAAAGSQWRVVLERFIQK
jgi:hypothetical protein